MSDAPRIGLSTLKRGILLFWALWFALAWLTNVLDALEAAGLLAPGWTFASGNYGFVREALALHGAEGLATVLFAGVLAWQALCLAAHARAFALFPDPARRRPAVTLAFAVSLALWAAFILADEALIAYATEAVHMRLFVAELVSLLALVLLPEGD